MPNTPLTENLLEAFIMDNIRRRITEDLVKKELDRIEKEIRPVIKEEVEKLTVAAVKRWYDMQCLRDEIGVAFRWSDDPDNIRRQEIER